MDMKDRIKTLCKEKGVSLNQVEKDCGCGSGYISKLGKTKPSSAKLQRIAAYFDKSLDYIITGEDKRIDALPVENVHFELIELFEKMNKEQQELWLKMGRELVTPK